jgi:hypothetical protein
LARAHFVALVRRGKNPDAFITTLAMRCSQAARSGRRVVSGYRKREAMPRRGTNRRTLTRIPLLDAEHRGAGGLSDALHEDVRIPVPRRVAFKLDFSMWRARLSGRNRAVLDALAAGGGTCEIAEAFGICPARVSQLRRELADGWSAFGTS